MTLFFGTPSLSDSGHILSQLASETSSEVAKGEVGLIDKAFGTQQPPQQHRAFWINQ
jgi:hypothetical protein